MRSFLLVVLVLMGSLIILPITLNYLVFWESGLSRGSLSDWSTLYGGIISGLIGGLLTYLGVKLTIDHNEKNENKKNKPRLEVLDHRLLLGSGHLRENREKIIITIQNFGGTIAKNIEATVIFDNFDMLTEEVHEILKDKIKLPQRIYSEVFKPKNSKGKAAYLVFEKQSVASEIADIHYGTLNQEYFRIIGNCVPITINYSANSEIVLPNDVHGWMAFFNGYNQRDYFDEGFFNVTLKLKYYSIDNEEHIKEFSLKFIDTKSHEMVEGTSKKLLILRASERI